MREERVQQPHEEHRLQNCEYNHEGSDETEAHSADSGWVCGELCANKTSLETGIFLLM